MGLSDDDDDDDGGGGAGDARQGGRRRPCRFIGRWVGKGENWTRQSVEADSKPPKPRYTCSSSRFSERSLPSGNETSDRRAIFGCAGQRLRAARSTDPGERAPASAFLRRALGRGDDCLQRRMGYLCKRPPSRYCSRTPRPAPAAFLLVVGVRAGVAEQHIRRVARSSSHRCRSAATAACWCTAAHDFSGGTDLPFSCSISTSATTLTIDRPLSRRSRS